MVKALLIAAAVAALAPARVEACLNGVEWTTNDYVRVVAKAERQVEDGDFGAAKRTLGKHRFPTQLHDRVADLRAILALRTTQDAKQLRRDEDGQGKGKIG